MFQGASMWAAGVCGRGKWPGAGALVSPARTLGGDSGGQPGYWYPIVHQVWLSPNFPPTPQFPFLPPSPSHFTPQPFFWPSAHSSVYVVCHIPPFTWSSLFPSTCFRSQHKGLATCHRHRWWPQSAFTRKSHLSYDTFPSPVICKAAGGTIFSTGRQL